MKRARKPEIMADAAYLILTKKSINESGRFYFVLLCLCRTKTCYAITVLLTFLNTRTTSTTTNT